MPKSLNKIAWDSVESSNVDALFFHEPSKTICVRFKTGGIYSYTGADHEIFTNLRMASSVGRYLNNVIKAFPYSRWEKEEDLLHYLNFEEKNVTI